MLLIKTRHKEKNLFDYHGSPAIRHVDNSSLDIGSASEQIATTTTVPATPTDQQAYTTPESIVGLLLQMLHLYL